MQIKIKMLNVYYWCLWCSLYNGLYFRLTSALISGVLDLPRTKNIGINLYE